MKPVTRRPGVTSKAGFIDGVALGDSHLLRGPFLDRIASRIQREVRTSTAGQRRRTDAEVRRDGSRRRTCRSVGGVAVARDAIGADDDRAQRLALHGDRGGASTINGTARRLSRSSNIVSRAPCKSGRVSSTKDVQRLPGAVRRDEAAQRRTVAAGRDRARVAVREHVPLAGKSATDACAMDRRRHAALRDAPRLVELVPGAAAKTRSTAQARFTPSGRAGADLRRSVLVAARSPAVQPSSERDAVRAELSRSPAPRARPAYGSPRRRP